MWKFGEVSFLLVFASIAFASCDEVEEKIKFELFNGGPKQVTTFNTSFAQQGCDMTGNFSFVTHGWHGSSTSWILDLISNLTFYRQGCVVFMNYSYYSDRDNYFEVISYFKQISKLVTRKLIQIRDEGASSDKMFLFGFSFGGRIVIEAALNYGPKRIGQIDSKHVTVESRSFDKSISF